MAKFQRRYEAARNLLYSRIAEGTMRLKLLVASLATSIALAAAPARATVVFIVSETPSGGFESLAIHETFEGAPSKDVALASLVSGGITYAPVTGCGDTGTCPGNVWVASPGYDNFGIPGSTGSSILTATGNEYFTVTPGFTSAALASTSTRSTSRAVPTASWEPTR